MTRYRLLVLSVLHVGYQQLDAPLEFAGASADHRAVLRHVVRVVCKRYPASELLVSAPPLEVVVEPRGGRRATNVPDQSLGRGEPAGERDADSLALEAAAGGNAGIHELLCDLGEPDVERVRRVLQRGRILTTRTDMERAQLSPAPELIICHAPIELLAFCRRHLAQTLLERLDLLQDLRDCHRLRGNRTSLQADVQAGEPRAANHGEDGNAD